MMLDPHSYNFHDNYVSILHYC